jgi:hypothetical protein
MYAAGLELDAMRRLEAAIKSGEDLGDAAVRAWGGLFELLQALNRRPAFDALALTFARRFEKSPPTWSPVVEGPHMASESSGGRAHVSLTGVLNAGIGEVLKQTMKLATTSTIVRMDLAKLDDADNDGATLLTRALAALKRAKREYVFGGPEHLAGILAAKLVPDGTVSRHHHPFRATWLAGRAGGRWPSHPGSHRHQGQRAQGAPALYNDRILAGLAPAARQMRSPCSSGSRPSSKSIRAICCARRWSWPRTGAPTVCCAAWRPCWPVADRDHSLIITGNGDVLEPEQGIVAIGSGGAYAQSAARALLENTDAVAG